MAILPRPTTFQSPFQVFNRAKAALASTPSSPARAGANPHQQDNAGAGHRADVVIVDSFLECAPKFSN